MTHFKLAGQRVRLSDDALYSGDLKLPLNDKTAAALMCLFKAPHETISKDDLIKQVWQGVIVSDASVFKVIQQIRETLMALGFDKSCLENVYGKGYRLKLDVKAVEPSVVARYKKPLAWPVVLALVIVLMIVLGTHTQPEQNLLDDSAKKDIIKLSKSDWQKGLEHINQLLDSDADYSTSDQAFLYLQQGQTRLNLQQSKAADESLTESMRLAIAARDDRAIGDAAIQMARADESFNRIESQQANIEKSINHYQKAGAKQQAIDAKLELAYYLRNHGQVELAKEQYLSVKAEAKEQGDVVGQAMAINNLAATYLLQNQVDEALPLAEEGLAISLQHGSGQHIANSYSFLSQLYTEKGNSKQALMMISEALKYQLQTKNHRHLSPKLLNLAHLLINTGQFQQADALLQTTLSFAQHINVKDDAVVVHFYMGQNDAHQGKWSKALLHFQKAYDLSLAKNFKFKKPDILAYLAMALAQTQKHVKAMEMAQNALNEPQAKPRHQTLAYWALALSAHQTEQHDLAQQWSEKANPETLDGWYFGQWMVAEFKKATTAKDDISGQNQAANEALQVRSAWQAYAHDHAIDAVLFKQLLDQVNDIVKEAKATKP